MIEGWAAAAVGAMAVGTVAGAAISSSGAQSAAQTQANAANNAQAISQNEFNTITAQENPYLQSGYGAQSQLNYLLGIGSPGGGSSPSGTPTPSQGQQGYDPSSGYRIGAGGSISQGIPGGSPLGSVIPSSGTGGTGGNLAATGQNPYPVGSPGYQMYAQNTANSPGMSTATQGMGTAGATGTSGFPTTASSSTAGGYGSLLSPFTADTFKQYSPAYQFQLQQGQQGVLNADSSGQGALSGAALKDLTGYNQGMANTSFNNAFNQYQTQQGNIYSRLAGIANLGQNAASNTAQSGTALAGQAAQSAQNAGNAIAAGTVGSANAWSGTASTLGSLAASNSAWGSSANPSVSSGFDGATVGG